MASLLPTSDEQPAIAVAKHIAELVWKEASSEVSIPKISQYVRESETLLASDKFVELVDLLTSSADTVLEKSSEKDAECVLSVIISLAAKSDSEESALKIADKIASLIASNAHHRSNLRLKLLFTLYNAISFPKVKFLVYLRAVQLSIDADVADLVIPTFRRLDKLVLEWGIDREQQSSLFLQVANIFDRNKESKESFSYLLKYLTTVPESSPAALEQSKEYAVAAIVGFIKSPSLFQKLEVGDRTVYINELLELPAVRQLESDSEHAPLHRLLSIFVHGYLIDYLQFYKENGPLIEKLGLNHDSNVTKMRLLSCIALAAESVSGEVKYSLLQQALQVDADDVEPWVVRAISGKLLDARLDQSKEVVIVNGVSLRNAFGGAQWKELRSNLLTWKEKLSNVSRILQSAKLGATLPQA